MSSQALFIALAVIVVLALLFLTCLWLNGKNRQIKTVDKQAETDPFDIDRENVRNLMGDNTR